MNAFTNTAATELNYKIFVEILRVGIQ